MKSIYRLLAAVSVVASASSSFASSLSPVVRKTSENATYCSSVSLGEVCRMTWSDALTYCSSQDAHLPTAREISELLPERGSVTLEVSAVNGTPPPGFYLVEGINPGGAKDAFYLNHSGYKRLAQDDQENYLIWTATTPPGYEQYAHVYYNSFGGGGGEKEDHLKTHPNNVMCAK